MIVVLDRDIARADIDRLTEDLGAAGLSAKLSGNGDPWMLVAAEQVPGRVRQWVRELPGVSRVVDVPGKFRLSSRDFQPESSTVTLDNGLTIGGTGFVVAAGPCAVESAELLSATADSVRAAGAEVLRGGAYKPRTSPYSFQGLGPAGADLLDQERKRSGLPVVTEVVDPGDVELLADRADMLQVGTRNMQNFALLSEVGRSGKPVLLKRGFAATIEEWLFAAEYVLSTGNTQVVLCERGIRSYDPSTRFTLDVSAVPVVKALSHLPVIIDPSHSSGRRDLVKPCLL